MKKLLKWFGVLLLLVIACFGFYFYKLNALALEGNRLYEYRCTNVNPHLIGYKNAFLKFADYGKNPDKYTEDEGVASIKDYWDGMRAYVPEEDKWLAMQYEYVNRWDFKLFMPQYLQQAADYQIKMQEGYRDDAKYLVEGFDLKEISEELSSKQKGARDKRNKYFELYNNFFEQSPDITDWRVYIINKPLPAGCNEENTVIPNTGGAIDWGDQEPDSEPEAPIDPDRSG